MRKDINVLRMECLEFSGEENVEQKEQYPFLEWSKGDRSLTLRTSKDDEHLECMKISVVKGNNAPSKIDVTTGVVHSLEEFKEIWSWLNAGSGEIWKSLFV